MEELDQTASSLTTGHREPIGRLRIDLPTTFGRRHIVPPLLELASQHDRLDLSFTLRDQAVHMVAEGIDLAVRIGTLGDYPDLIARPQPANPTSSMPGRLELPMVRPC